VVVQEEECTGVNIQPPESAPEDVDQKEEVDNVEEEGDGDEKDKEISRIGLSFMMMRW